MTTSSQPNHSSWTVSVLLVLLSVWCIVKHPEPPEKLITPFLWILGALICLSGFSIVQKVITQVISEVQYESEIAHNSVIQMADRPDIYIFLVDGYGRQDQLLERNIDNSPFIASLRQMDFVVDELQLFQLHPHGAIALIHDEYELFE